MDTPSPFTPLAERFLQSIPHMRACGLTPGRLEAGDVELVLPYRDSWLGDPERGILHTGVLTMLVDSASGLAVFTALPAREGIATLDLRMDYLRPAVRDQAVTCRAECYRLTSQIAFVRAQVWQDDPALPVAVSQSTFMRLGARAKSPPL